METETGRLTLGRCSQQTPGGQPKYFDVVRELPHLLCHQQPENHLLPTKLQGKHENVRDILSNVEEWVSAPVAAKD